MTGQPLPDAVPSLAQAPEIHRRYALLIGVGVYVDPHYASIDHAVNDVVELEKTLARAGYVVRCLHSKQAEETLRPTRSNILGELENLARQTGPGDLLLVYFGGHGDLVNGRAYLVASDTRRSSMHHTGVYLDEFKASLAEAPAQARILLLDACHAGIGRSGDTMNAEFEHHIYLTATGTATLASCRKDERSYEHAQSRHGAFTYFLLQALRGGAVQTGQRFVTFNHLSAYVTHQVKEWAFQQSLQQWPNASTQLVGDPPLIELAQPGVRTLHPLPANPFAEMRAIRDPARFVGRTADLERLTRVLAGASVTITGEPKIGKSSLLWQLAQRWPGKLIGPLDCQGYEDCDDFYADLAQQLALTDHTWRTLRNALRRQAALILLDEMDAAAHWRFTSEHLGRFRALCGDNPALHLVMVSRTPLRAVFPDTGRGSPPYNFLMPLTLGPLADVEARQLLAHPWAPDAPVFDEPVCRQLLDLAGAHPFRLQRAAFHRYEALADPAYDWQAAYQRDLEHLQ